VTTLDAHKFVLANVTREVAGVSILDQVDLEIYASGFTVVVGRSGSGKTSLLRILNRLDAPTSGTVTWSATDLASTDICALRRSVGYVAQRPLMFEGTALDNLRVADPDIDRGRANELLLLVGLAEQTDQTASTLSGGEAQRLCIARTLATNPIVILADEPTASLDADATHKIEALARQLVDTRGVAWVWLSHDIAQMKRLADTVVVMDSGRVLASGTLIELSDHRLAEVRHAVDAP